MTFFFNANLVLLEMMQSSCLFFENNEYILMESILQNIDALFDNLMNLS